MCNELLLKLQYKSFEKETKYTGIPPVSMPACTKNEIPPPLVNIFSKIRMLRAGKWMYCPFFNHLYDRLLRRHGANMAPTFFSWSFDKIDPRSAQIREATHVASLTDLGRK